MDFPQNLYVTIDKDGKLLVFDKEENVPVPVDSFAPMATYQLVKSEEAQRRIVIDKRATPIVPTQPTNA